MAWQKVLSGIADPLDLFGGRAAYDAKQARKDAKSAQERAEQARREAIEAAQGLRERIPGEGEFAREVWYDFYDLPDSELAQRADRVSDKWYDIYRQGGMDEITRAENEQARSEYNRQARAQRQAALQNLQSRGMGGSGASMAAQLQSGQSSADAAYQARLGNLAEGRQRAMQALQRHGSAEAMAGSAIDQFNRDNTQYRRDLAQRNADRENEQMWRVHGADESATALETGQYGQQGSAQGGYAAEQRARAQQIGQQSRQQQQQTGGALAGLLGAAISDENAKEGARRASPREIEAALEAGRRAGAREAEARSIASWDRVPADTMQRIRDRIVQENPGITGEELAGGGPQSTPRGVPAFDQASRFTGEPTEPEPSPGVPAFDRASRFLGEPAEPEKDDKEPTSSLLEGIVPSTYKYRPEHQAEGGAGPQLGVMAQDLERSPMGRAMVEDGPDGVKRVDVRKAALANLAATSDLHERLKRLEGGSRG